VDSTNLLAAEIKFNPHSAMIDKADGGKEMCDEISSLYFASYCRKFIIKYKISKLGLTYIYLTSSRKKSCLLY